MKKKLYDFTRSNAIIFILAYIMLFTLNIFSIIRNNNESISDYIFLVFLLISFVWLIIYFVFMAVSVEETEVKHGKKRILKKDLDVYIRPNYRLKYNEIIFRNKHVQYNMLDKKQIKKQEIAVQHFMKYECFLLGYLNVKELKQWSSE